MRDRKLKLGSRKFLAALAACAMLAGCATADKAGAVAGKAWDFYNANYDRSLSVSTTTDGKPQVAYTITPRAPAAPAATPAPSALTDEQIAALLAHFAQYAAKDGKAVIPSTK